MCNLAASTPTRHHKIASWYSRQNAKKNQVHFKNLFYRTLFSNQFYFSAYYVLILRRYWRRGNYFTTNMTAHLWHCSIRWPVGSRRTLVRVGNVDVSRMRTTLTSIGAVCTAVRRCFWTRTVIFSRQRSFTRFHACVQSSINQSINNSYTWHHSVYNSKRRHVGGMLCYSNVVKMLCVELHSSQNARSSNNLGTRMVRFPHLTQFCSQ